MNKNALKSNIGIIVAIGSIWCLIEFAFGLGLQKCATLVTGAILTGLAFFWLSFIWSITRHIIPILILVGIVMLFKWLDALLLTKLFRKRFPETLMSRIFVGAGAAAITCALFPRARVIY